MILNFSLYLILNLFYYNIWLNVYCAPSENYINQKNSIDDILAYAFNYSKEKTEIDAATLNNHSNSFDVDIDVFFNEKENEPIIKVKMKNLNNTIRHVCEKCMKPNDESVLSFFLMLDCLNQETNAENLKLLSLLKSILSGFLKHDTTNGDKLLKITTPIVTYISMATNTTLSPITITSSSNNLVTNNSQTTPGTTFSKTSTKQNSSSTKSEYNSTKQEILLTSTKYNTTNKNTTTVSTEKAKTLSTTEDMEPEVFFGKRGI